MTLSQTSLPKIPLSNDLCSRKFNNSISATMMPHHLQDHSISKLRIAYQGVPGAYGEAAAMKAYPNCETVQCQQFEDTIQAVERGWAEEAVIPIENSIGGSVLTNYDLLLRHALHVVGETHLFVDHCLLALPAVPKHHLTCVFSHPQALIQCEMSLKMLGAATVPTENTAVAAQTVASQGVREYGAIASARAAQLYGLHIVAHKFQALYKNEIRDRPDNITRFLKLARKPVIPTTDTRSKTSIAFIPDEGPQELHKTLSVFAQTGIHISKIESRPLEKHSTNAVNGFKHGRNMYFKHVYFLDFEASVIDPRAQYALERLQIESRPLEKHSTIAVNGFKHGSNMYEASVIEPRAQHALELLQELASYVRVLGCYPMDPATWKHFLLEDGRLEFVIRKNSSAYICTMQMELGTPNPTHHALTYSYTM